MLLFTCCTNTFTRISSKSVCAVDLIMPLYHCCNSFVLSCFCLTKHVMAMMTVGDTERERSVVTSSVEHPLLLMRLAKRENNQHNEIKVPATTSPL